MSSTSQNHSLSNSPRPKPATRKLAGLAFLVLVPLLGWAASGLAQESAPSRASLPAPPDDVRQAMTDGATEKALELLDALIQSEPKSADLWTFFRAVALQNAERWSEADAAFQALSKDHPDSPWLLQATYRRASIAQQTRNFGLAEQIYSEAAKNLLSMDRQADLASIYTGLADLIAAPQDPTDPQSPKPRHEQAVELYSKAYALHATPEVRAHAAFQMGRSFQALGRHAEAAHQFANFLQLVPDTTRSQHWEARLAQAESIGLGFMARQQRRALQDLLREASDQLRQANASEDLKATLQESMAAAQKLLGDSWQSSKRTPLAISAWEKCLELYPNDRNAPAVAVSIAMNASGDEPLKAWDRVLEMTIEPQSIARLKPEERESYLAEHEERMRSALFSKGNALKERARFTDAIRVFAEYTRRYPDGKNWADAQQGILDAELSIADQARSEGRFADAREAYAQYLTRHPLDKAASDVQITIGTTFIEEAKQDEVAVDVPSLFQKAIAQWELCAASQGTKDTASLALYRIAQTYENELLDAGAAVKAYRKVNFGSYADAARNRLEEMLKTQLAIETERTVRSNEPVHIKVQTRNIDNLEVHVHALDLESYFRKHHTHARVEDLDLDLIAPEQRFEQAVSDYSPYTPMEFQLDIPVDGPGVWVVSVIGGEKRATTLVLRSDLDLVVKASKQDVLVYVQDMLKGAPAAGVNVLISVPTEDSHEIVTVQTGADGVAIWKPETPRNPDANCHVLAMSGAQVASTAFQTLGLHSSQALAPKSVIYTERPAYRPGEDVHWRAIALKSKDGQWLAAEDTVARVTLIGSGGQTYRQQLTALGPRGSLDGTFSLPEDAQPGSWSLNFSGAELETTTCHFEVESFRMPLAEVVLTPDKDLAWRGDRVTITAQASTTYGAPLADTLLVWSIPGHGQVEVRTDKQGQAQYTLETQEYGEAQVLTVVASLPTENVHGRTSVQLAVSGFSAAIELERSLELAGTTFPVTISTIAPNGKPVGQTMTLRIKRNTNPGQGRWKEELLLEREVTTDPKTGKASVPVEIAMGCQATLMVQGRDQFGQRIEASANLQISGAEDATKLRILTRNTSLDLGQKGSIQAINRASAGLALLTVETDRVVEYRLVHLNEGNNDFEFQTQGIHVPAVVVSLSFMDSHRFHEASARFEVQSRLNLEIIPGAETCAPGSAGRITIRATDGSGQPVQGDFSLAAVEEALFQLYPGSELDLAKHFAHPVRSFPTVSTQSTCEFHYAGSTTEIAQSILEEEKRLEQQQEWERARAKLRQGPASPGPSKNDWMLGVGLEEGEPEELGELNDMVGLGGGAGGSFGGRFGGRRTLSARGGGSSEADATGPPDSPTALWIARVQTDANGVGVIDAVWPQRSTRWRLTAHGVGDGNRFGSAISHVTTQSDFFVELWTPPLLAAGDRPQMRVKIHDSAMIAGTAKVELHVTTADGPMNFQADVALGGNSIVEYTFPMLDPLSGGQDLQVTAVVAVERDSQRMETGATKEITVEPAGWERVVSRSGTLTDQIQLNMDLDGTDRILELHFGVTLEDDLILQALGQGVFPTTCRWNGGSVQQASDLMSACAVFSAMRGQSGHPSYSPLEDRIQGLVASLAAGQQSNGGWSWSGQETQGDVHSTAHVALALAQAKALGVGVDLDTWTRLRQQLNKFLRGAATTDLEARTHLLHALAAMGYGDFAALNQLYRSRAQMSTASQARLALALAAADRIAMAAEIVAEIAGQAIQADGKELWNPTPQASWVTSQAETTALVTLAMHAVKRPAKESKPACDFLASQRPWPNPRTRGYAVWALAQQGLQHLPGQANGFVSVHVAGQEPSRVALTSQPGHRHTMLRLALADSNATPRKGKVTIDLGLSGNIVPQYTAILKGNVQTPAAQRVAPFVVKSRLFLASPTRYEGNLMPTGFNSVVERNRWRNERSEIAPGEVIHLEVTAQRQYTKVAELDQRTEYLELQVPIPSGLEVFDSRRSNERPYRQVGNSLVFPLGPVSNQEPVRIFEVSLVATYPGVYPAPRVLLRSAYHPELLAVSEASHITLLPQGSPSSDRYRMTPDESFYLGKALFEDQKLDRARGLLLPLLDEFENKLRGDFLKDTARMLLFASVDAGTPNEIVRYFEIIKQREPDLFIPIDQVLKIGAAYSELGEHERAMLIFRATLNEAFGKDLQIVGTLDQQNHWLMATRLLDRLIGDYPDLPVTVETDLTLANRVLEMAPKAHLRKDLTRVGADRAALTGMGIQRLKRFLALHPKSPQSADAALNLVSALFDLEDHKSAAALCAEMAPLYNEPIYLDAFRYSGAVSSWYLGDEDTALKELLAISQAKYELPNQPPMESPNKDLAKYIMAQIYHARKDIEPAARYYKEIEGQYPDAALALASMLNQELQLTEEVVRVHPGDSVELTILHRNLERAELLVYPVDLMTLYLREKDLSRVTQVNLAGVSPKYRGTLDLPAGANLRNKEFKTSLPLSEPGAYLVILRGGSLHASSLVLVSDIELDVSEYRNGNVRVQVSSHQKEAFIKDVDIRVLGSDDGRISIGKTDKRGLFSADSVRGKATIIARLGHDQYAFHRGEQSLAEDANADKDLPAVVANPQQSFYTSNVLDLNSFSVDNGKEALDREIQSDRKGVQVLTVY